MIISDIQAAILAFVGLLLALIIGAACGLLLLAFHNQLKCSQLGKRTVRLSRKGTISSSDFVRIQFDFVRFKQNKKNVA